MRGGPVLVLTGATSGMGLRLAERLLTTTDAHLVIGARSPDRVAGPFREKRDRVTVLPLDTARLASVRRFVADLRDRLGERRIAGIACNAGVQLVGPKTMTEDGVEATFATNHLGHFALVQALLDRIEPGGIVVSTASGTHNPDDRLARRFGFRGGLFPSADAVAAGDLDPAASIGQQGIDRYATSKLCNILYTLEMARRIPADRVRFVAYDPGLMPGTGLARDRSALERFGWTYVMPAMRWILPGVSSARQSARTMADRLLMSKEAPVSGAYVDFTGRPAAISADAERRDLARDLFTVSARLAGTAP